MLFYYRLDSSYSYCISEFLNWCLVFILVIFNGTNVPFFGSAVSLMDAGGSIAEDIDQE